MARGRTAEGATLAGCSIRVVTNRTGIAADTLRVWERRYGFPKPSHREGGSRVYSEDDIARLKLLTRAISAGFRPGEVVPLPLEELERVVARSEEGATPGPERRIESESLVSVDSVLAAVAEEDVPRMRLELRVAAVALGPKRFVTEVAHPLAVRLGELWERGELEVRHEHLATAALTTQLRLLLGALDEGERAPVVLLATLPGETHVLGLEMVAVYLAASRGAPRLLGADTPSDQIVASARTMRVDAVGLSISAASDLGAAEKAVRGLRAALPPSTPLWVGGEGSISFAIDGVRRVGTWADLDAALRVGPSAPSPSRLRRPA
jgi:MerR family transcriptional regulator, light-induced transcriptional regulator